ASPTVTVAAPTTAVGAGAVDVTASDVAGNTTTVSCAYKVQYRFVGLAATVSESKTNVVKAGRSLELGWWLADYAYKPVSTTASFSGATTTPVACPAGATSTPLVTTTASGYQSLGLGLHLYSWKAPSSLVGQCAQVTVNLADGTSHSIVAKVK
ncbi:MAG: PxKF domain-containing protein, partial [Acidimicrobiia bacterium]